MGKPQLISEILKPLLKRFGLEAQIQIYTLMDQWEAFVGHQIASHTHPYQLKFHKLYLYVDSPAWMSQLIYLKEELKNKINKEVGAIWVQEIVMKVGTIEAENSADKA
jgi:predicted nucleic acid-binding Zn ribbon protein